MPFYSSYTDTELFAYIARGDEEAFAQLFHAYVPKLLPFITKLTKSEHMDQEIIQETFLRIWMNRTDLLTIQHPPAWIYKIASNVSLTYLKTLDNRKRLLQKVIVPDAAESLSDALDSKELHLIIQRAVTMLPDRRQEIYRLSREEGLTHQQIAEKLHLSQNTVKNQIGISLKFIQEFINKETGLSIVTLLLIFAR